MDHMIYLSYNLALGYEPCHNIVYIEFAIWYEPYTMGYKKHPYRYNLFTLQGRH